MSRVSGKLCVWAAMIVVIVALGMPVCAKASGSGAPPDSGLFTNYSLFSVSGGTNVDWIVCGSTQDSEGCYGSGQLGPFVTVGAVLEGVPAVKGNVVTRAIYIVDSGGANAKLYVYKKVDTVTSDSDTITVTLEHTISLPLTGGTSATCSMAANPKFLFIGTDQSEQAVMVRKSDLSVSKVSIYTLGVNVASITSDQYGYITVTQVAGVVGGFAVFDPDGNALIDGGGADFMAGTRQAVPLASLMTSNEPNLNVGYRPKVKQ